MLETTYLHAQGVGRLTEQRLWQAGATDWDAYLDSPDSRWPLTRSQRALLTPTVEESHERLDDEDFGWFARRLPAAEHWRAVPAFGHRLAFVDIETTGGMAPSDLTVVGIFDGRNVRQFVSGIDLDQAPYALQDAAMLVTFFGTGFDLPFLRRAFPGLPMPQLHVDLCFALKRLGYRGGLKQIEREFGIGRSAQTRGLSGWDAVRLWNEYRSGRARSLDTLLTYNAEDIRNLAPLLSEAYRRLTSHTLESSGVNVGAAPPA
jgi:uncharacterized protein YprB with RNaseH-like and TPR domain